MPLFHFLYYLPPELPFNKCWLFPLYHPCMYLTSLSLPPTFLFLCSVLRAITSDLYSRSLILFLIRYLNLTLSFFFLINFEIICMKNKLDPVRMCGFMSLDSRIHPWNYHHNQDNNISIISHKIPCVFFTICIFPSTSQIRKSLICFQSL